MITFEFLDVQLVVKAIERLKVLDVSEEVENSWSTTFITEDEDFIYEFDCQYGDVVGIKVIENI